MSWKIYPPSWHFKFVLGSERFDDALFISLGFVTLNFGNYAWDAT